MKKKRKESFWKKYAFVPAWISLILSCTALPYLIFLVTKTPFVITTGCKVNYSSKLNQILQNKCNELTVGEASYLSQEEISQFATVPENTLIEAKISRQETELCTVHFYCTSVRKFQETVIIGDSVEVCLIKPSTNETICQTV